LLEGKRVQVPREKGKRRVALLGAESIINVGEKPMSGHLKREELADTRDLQLEH